MIPIRDTEPSRTRPVIVMILIAVNAAVFLYETSLPPEALESFMGDFGLVAATYFGEADSTALPVRVLPVFTSMFLHAGWLHVGFNMLFLWIFGDNVEDRLGRLRFTVFYFACGAAGAYAQLYLNPDSTLPMVGASGAIAGVMGGYFVLFPKSRVLTLVPVFYFIHVVELPAMLFLGFWFLLQFVTGTVTALSGAAKAGGTAWWAHVGGFGAGLTFVKVLELTRGGREDDGSGGRGYGTSPDEAVGGESWGYEWRGRSGYFSVPRPG